MGKQGKVIYHDFHKKLAEGKEHEDALDVHFSGTYEIQYVPRGADRLGIDRLFIHRGTRNRYSVEYKSDSEAAQTGNAFVEIVSVDTTGALGWAKTCCAQWLIYYIPPTGRGYWFSPCAIKAHLEQWGRLYPVRKSYNNGYASKGICVPLGVFTSLALVRRNFIVHRP